VTDSLSGGKMTVKEANKAVVQLQDVSVCGRRLGKEKGDMEYDYVDHEAISWSLL